jgi:murein L,D-transpeptidase YafK
MKRVAITVLIVALVALLSWANWPEPGLPLGTRVDRVVIAKAARRLDLRLGQNVIASYEVSLGWNPVGPKEREGDRKTPEGLYRITEHKANSSYHKALRLSYPSEADTARARTRGVNPGSDIMIHGIRNGLGWLGKIHRVVDWTAGCVALTDAEIDQLWVAVPDGTIVEIKP